MCKCRLKHDITQYPKLDIQPLQNNVKYGHTPIATHIAYVHLMMLSYGYISTIDVLY